MDTKKIQVGEDTVYFEKGPRTLRLSTGELKELNSLKLVNWTSFSLQSRKKLYLLIQLWKAMDLGLEEHIDLISKAHPASKNRYIYLNNKVNAVRKLIRHSNENIWHLDLLI